MTERAVARLADASSLQSEGYADVAGDRLFPGRWLGATKHPTGTSRAVLASREAGGRNQRIGKESMFVKKAAREAAVGLKQIR